MLVQELRVLVRELVARALQRGCEEWSSVGMHVQSCAHLICLIAVWVLQSQEGIREGTGKCVGMLVQELRVLICQMVTLMGTGSLGGGIKMQACEVWILRRVHLSVYSACTSTQDSSFPLGLLFSQGNLGWLISEDENRETQTHRHKNDNDKSARAEAHPMQLLKACALSGAVRVKC